MRGKHAYLIMVHDKFDMLEILVHMIDHERNDVFIHVDKKVRDVPFEKIRRSAQKSGVFFTDRINVTWGDYSQILCEMTLIKAAVKKEQYQYLHLLSGVDLPIKSQRYIFDFFDRNDGYEFIDIDKDADDQHIQARCRYYWLFQKQNARHTKKSLFRIMEGISVRVQKKVGVCRVSPEVQVKKGANWFSITGDFANYVVESEAFIRKQFRFSFCGDEVFLQTLLWNSDYRNRLYNAQDNESLSRRLIDWKRGKPYVFKISDIDMLEESSCIFARKFDKEVDFNIIELINSRHNKEIN